MKPSEIDQAAEILWTHWNGRSRLACLPESCRPRDRAEAYAVQAAVAGRSGQQVVGWKIAATSAAGQAHIGVDGPLAGRLLSARVLPAGASVSLAGNLMKVAEAEFAFRLGKPLPKRAGEYSREEVLAAVESMHLSIEIPDSRYEDFARVGAPQLIADHACASWLVLGGPVDAPWRERDLAGHAVSARRNGELAGQGHGRNVLGDPLIALTWIANELRSYAEGLRAGDVVTTGTCLTPVAVAPGDRIAVDYGDFGTLTAALA
jgi:2-keto-4-pentenoate hydratase